MNEEKRISELIRRNLCSHDVASLIFRKEKRITELENILKDFVTTKECRTTWIEEMHLTILDVLGDDSE